MVKKIDPKVKSMSPAEKRKLLETEMALLNKRFGKKVLQFGYDKVVKRIPFKSNALNEITGGGVPEGRFSVIWGSKGSTKTTSCYDLVANAQMSGKLCMWIDLERSFDPSWAAKQGVNVEELLMAPSFSTAEEAMDSIITLTKSKAIDLIVIDSIQGLSPKGEQETKKGVEKSLEDDTMALLARKLSQFFRISASGVAESDCTVVLIGQTRMDLGGFITLEKLSGGNALEHWSSLTVHVRRGAKSEAPTKSVKNEDTGRYNKEICGFCVVAKIDKSKVGPDEGREARIDFIFGEGFKSREEKDSNEKAS